MPVRFDLYVLAIFLGGFGVLWNHWGAGIAMDIVGCCLIGYGLASIFELFIHK